MNNYLHKYGFQPIQINSPVPEELAMVVVIPCYKEKGILDTLTALSICDKPRGGVEVIVVINQSEAESEEIKKLNLQTFHSVMQWKEKTTLPFRLEVLMEKALPKKHAGVGLARKIGMDEAVARFHKIQKDGIIVCLDADCLVEKNYFVAIENHFQTHPKTPGCSIRYAHPIEGKEFDEDTYDGIINYELFLRYYNLGLAYANLAYAYHTVGSSMAVTSSAYQKQGGMNKRKAGEDFYFLHKIIALGNFTELQTTKVIPSPRVSDRVPFGTGKAINDYLNQTDKDVYFTYDFTVFGVLKQLVGDIETIYQSEEYCIQNNALGDFLGREDWKSQIKEIKKNTRSLESFKKRFFVFLDAFKVLKFVHFYRDNYFPNKEIKGEVLELLKHLNYSISIHVSKKELLQILRSIENKKA